MRSVIGAEQPSDIDDLWPDEAETGAMLRSHYRRHPSREVMARHLDDLERELAEWEKVKPGRTRPMLTVALASAAVVIVGLALTFGSGPLRIRAVEGDLVEPADATSTTLDQVPRSTTMVPTTFPNSVPQVSVSSSSTTRPTSTVSSSAPRGSTPTSAPPARDPGVPAGAPPAVSSGSASTVAVTPTVPAAAAAGSRSDGESRQVAVVPVEPSDTTIGPSSTASSTTIWTTTTTATTTTATTWETTTVPPSTAPSSTVPPSTTTTTQSAPECVETGLLFRRSNCSGSGGLLGNLLDLTPLGRLF